VRFKLERKNDDDVSVGFEGIQKFDDKVPLKDQLEIVAAYRQSGLSQAGFCQEFGVPYSRFKNWIRRPQTRKTDQSGASAFVPVVLVKAPNHSSVSRQSDGDDLMNFRVYFAGRHGDMSLMIPKAFDEGALHRLMAALSVTHV
jgi:hypothetical protein